MQNEDPAQLAAELRRLTGRFAALKVDKRVDKKWLNKVVARLEEVDAFCDRLYKPEVKSLLNDAPNGCTCPMPGVLDTNCPVHGGR